jgi:hypothetical protein
VDRRTSSDRSQPHALTAQQLLTAWERGRDSSVAERALLLLSLSSVDGTAAGPLKLTAGQFNAHLLDLRRRVLGERLEGTASCPACGEQLEIELETAALLADGDGATSAAPVEGGAEVRLNGWRVSVRPPTLADLLAVSEVGEREALELLERCLLEVEGPPGTIPLELVAAIAEQLTAADPLAQLELALSCPACGHDWSALLHPVSFVWAELDSWAARTLREVHRLGVGYGWSESEILALSSRRRQAYLALLAAT